MNVFTAESLPTGGHCWPPPLTALVLNPQLGSDSTRSQWEARRLHPPPPHPPPPRPHLFLGRELKWELDLSLLTAVFAPEYVPVAFPPLRAHHSRSGGRLPLQSKGCSLVSMLLSPNSPHSRLPTGFDLMNLFRVKDVLGQREDGVQSSYVRMGSFPVVQRTE